jgi:Tfp pilus assembly ATPase PilU
VCQRLIPRKQDGERVAVFEIVRPESPQLSLQEGESTIPKPLDRALDQEIERLVRTGVIAPDMALAHAHDPGSLAARLNCSQRGQ